MDTAIFIKGTLKQKAMQQQQQYNVFHNPLPVECILWETPTENSIEN